MGTLTLRLSDEPIVTVPAELARQVGLEEGEVQVILGEQSLTVMPGTSPEDYQSIERPGHCSSLPGSAHVEGSLPRFRIESAHRTRTNTNSTSFLSVCFRVHLCPIPFPESPHSRLPRFSGPSQVEAQPLETLPYLGLQSRPSPSDCLGRWPRGRGWLNCPHIDFCFMTSLPAQSAPSPCAAFRTASYV